MTDPRRKQLGKQLDWESYRDKLGFISGTRNPEGSSGNAVLFAAEEAILRRKLDDWSGSVTLVQSIRACCEIERGLLKRPHPFSQDQESLDDYIGLAAIDPGLAREALAYGRAHFYRPLPFLKLAYQYSMRNEEKDVIAWLGRFPAMIAHLQFAAGETPPLWRRLWWTASIAMSGKPDQQDPWILSWVMLETNAKGDSFLADVAHGFWRWRLERAYPKGLSEVFRKYFNDEAHPIANACVILGI